MRKRGNCAIGTEIERERRRKEGWGKKYREQIDRERKKWTREREEVDGEREKRDMERVRE